MNSSNMLRGFLALAILLLIPTAASAQYNIRQEAMAEVLADCTTGVAESPEIAYEYFELYNTKGNSVLARNTFKHLLGDGDLDLGIKRAKLVGLINRQLVENAKVGDRFVIPKNFDHEYCDYSPFPRVYEAGRGFDKLFIIDKTLQTFAAYEKGELVRWGIVNTGGEESRTPNGRFNFNWRSEYRVSSLSPPGEPWEMYWVVNFHEARGIHTHQYAMPTGGPTSHGCVRLIEEDAKFIYDWADTWKTTTGGGPSTPKTKIIEPGTTVLVIGEDPAVAPEPFRTVNGFPVLNRVELPADPYEIPPGTEQQKLFDQKRKDTR
jgi:hypothetical protein